MSDPKDVLRARKAALDCDNQERWTLEHVEKIILRVIEETREDELSKWHPEFGTEWRELCDERDQLRAALVAAEGEMKP